MDDNIGTNAFPYKCNAITLLRDNPDLKRLCLATRGKYVHVKNTDSIEESE